MKDENQMTYALVWEETDGFGAWVIRPNPGPIRNPPLAITLGLEREDDSEARYWARKKLAEHGITIGAWEPVAGTFRAEASQA